MRKIKIGMKIMILVIMKNQMVLMKVLMPVMREKRLEKKNQMVLATMIQPAEMLPMKKVLKKVLKKRILNVQKNLKKVHRLLVQKVEKMVLMSPNQKPIQISETMKANWYRMKQKLTDI